MKQFFAPCFFVRILITVTILFTPSVIRAQFSATGISAGTVTTTSVTQGFDWTNPINIQTANTTYATSLITGANRSTYFLDAKNWGFQTTTSGQPNYIPPAATINGIEVYITRRRTNTGSVKGAKIQLLKAGAEVGTNKSNGATWPTTPATIIFGSSVDLWGTTWTASDFVNANFGVRIQARNQGNKPAQAEVDYVRIIVYFNQTFYNSKSTGNLELTSSWGINADGSGAAPPNFTNNGQIFVLRNRAAASLTANLTITGTNSKMVVGDGTSATTLTVPSGFVLTGTTDIAANSSLVINNTTSPGIGAIGTGTTITYGATADQPVPEGNYYNLTLSGSGTKSLQTVSGTTLVANVLTIASGVTFNNQGNNVVVAGITNGISNSGSAIGTGRYVYSASDVNTSITGTGAAVYSNLEVFFSTTAATRTLTLGNAANITGTLYLTDGSFANGANLTMSPGSTIAMADGTLSNTIAGSTGYDVVYNPYVTASPKTTANELSGSLRNFTMQTGTGLAVNLNQNLVLTGSLNLISGTLDPTATLYNITLGGDFVNNATITARNNTTTFNGSAAQSIGGSGAQAFYNLTVNNAAGGSLQLGVPASVSNVLTLTNGIVTTSGTNLLTLGNTSTITAGSATSFINGPLQRTVGGLTGSRAFPIGKGNFYKPILLSANQVAATPTLYTAELFNTAPPARTLPVTLDKVSEIRYYNIGSGNISNLVNASVMINYGPDDGVSDAASLRIAKSNAGSWEDIGGMGSGSPTGTITSNLFTTSLGDFVLANATGGNNVLPLRWVSFDAGKNGGEVRLGWKTADEVNTLRFEIERSSNGSVWSTLGQVPSKNGLVNDYSFVDKMPLSHVNLYRIKLVDSDGKSNYSRTAVVNFNERSEGLTIMPNPVRTGQLNFLLHDADMLKEDRLMVRIIDMNGKTVSTASVKPVPVMRIDVSLVPGNYYLYIQSDHRQMKKAFIVVNR